MIRKLNPRGNIFVCPVLPTRDVEINNRVKLFNNLLMSDLPRAQLGVHLVDGFDNFWSRYTNKLCDNLSDIMNRPRDVLHLNDNSGVKVLVKLIKQSIFSVKKIRKTRSVGSRTTTRTTDQATKKRGLWLL